MLIEMYKPSETPEKTVRIKPVQTGADLRFVAVDENGDRLREGNLFTIQENGRIHLFSSVSPDLGFALDSKGRIQTD